MPYEHKNGDLRAFENEKGNNPKRPDFTGYILAHRDIAAGEKIAVSIWQRESKSAAQYLSGQVSDYKEREPKKQSASAAPKRTQPANPSAPFEDEIPFAHNN